MEGLQRYRGGRGASNLHTAIEPGGTRTGGRGGERPEVKIVSGDHDAEELNQARAWQSCQLVSVDASAGQHQQAVFQPGKKTAGAGVRG